MRGKCRQLALQGGNLGFRLSSNLLWRTRNEICPSCMVIFEEKKTCWSCFFHCGNHIVVTATLALDLVIGVIHLANRVGSVSNLLIQFESIWGLHTVLYIYELLHFHPGGRQSLQCFVLKDLCQSVIYQTSRYWLHHQFVSVLQDLCQPFRFRASSS